MNGEHTKPREALSEDLRLVLENTAEFQIDKDGDLEIDTSPGTGSERWAGVYLSREQALQLRDFLNRMLP